jgi:hypothetical protein
VVVVVGSTGFGLPIWLSGTAPVAELGLAPVPWSVGDADGLPEPESDGDGDVDTEGDGLDDGDDGADVAGWDGGAELGVLGPAESGGDCEGLGDSLEVGQGVEAMIG